MDIQKDTDTDLVTLFLPLLIGLAPAVWVMHFLRHPLALPFRWFQRWTQRRSAHATASWFRARESS